MATKVRVNAQEFAEKWANNMTSNVSNIIKGVDRVQESPTQKAAANKEKWLRGIQESYNNGNYERGCNKVSVEDWKRITKQKMASNLASGVSTAKQKVATMAQGLISHINSGLDALHAMPKANLADSKARSAAWIDHMASFQK